MDMAVGIIIGADFGKVVTSLVTDVLINNWVNEAQVSNNYGSNSFRFPPLICFR